MTAIELIDAERSRQVMFEGWDVDHDDKHTGGELAAAAACYAITSLWSDPFITGMWPWPAEQYKPSPDDRIRELVKAGALILAEIERLQRAGG